MMTMVIVHRLVAMSPSGDVAMVVVSLGGGGMVVEWPGGCCRLDWWWCRLRVMGV